ncbi:nucleoside hydrolase [Hyphobacterium sp.]|uniref:nucleoside hydrolase n=1 Tax=Hyphobacterium sp. TaxID=2004662 RepID=UPI003BAAAFEB
MARPIIIDCDPGVDDCFALLTALASPEELEIKGICTVAGNVPVETCTKNALGLLTFTGRTDIPVYQGCPRPIQEAPVFASHIHGETGLGAARLPEPVVDARPEHAVAFLIDTLRSASPASITLVPTGPLTNLGLALVEAPDIAEAIAEIVIMGGAFETGGNITETAEFNMYADPHAADIVMSCGRPITLIGLDATLKFRCTVERMKMLSDARHKTTDLISEMIGHVNDIYGEIYGEDGAAMHDPCTIGYLLAPHLFEARTAHVRVETEGRRGHTAVDVHLLGDAKPNVNWVDGLDAPRLFELLLSRITRL